MNKIYLLILGLCSTFFAQAQITAINILQQTAAKIHLLKSISYEVKETDINPFSVGDTTRSTAKVSIVFTKAGAVNSLLMKTSMNDGKTLLCDIFYKDTLYSVDLDDSTYVTSKQKPIPDISSTLDFITNSLKSPSKIFYQKDTIIAKAACYQIFIKSYDTVANGLHNYTYNYIAINKKSLLPTYIRQAGEGSVEKDGHSLGRLKMFSEKTFFNLKANKRINDNLFRFDKTIYSIKNTQMLANGAVAPILILKDLSNQIVPPASFKHKVLLVEFGGTTCAANPLANPMLNRLAQKYPSKDFAIASIYSVETSTQVKQYIAGNGIAFPVYLGTKKVLNEFKTIGTPNFYLIDKNGKIIKSSNGYSNELEKELTAEIDKLVH
ncbi:TlpA disulfide reductase family protein [Mucilaginibacter polytrichastri]|uniref:Thioredoxin domain-containing protein n=1 Tax=Mucilaginibacter polytrichastri TaxID=1302689 RepID=A0A1Q6A3G2_9SPHI|nr:TlpA disulfide reductase family protein [Mucilaginibacter polytrichastri]OKS88542.1 hypothetical protein RG47T_4011 [Mucilaginibacter polytrichastri]SFT11723.1 Thiol-disulfide isomerase or thioredoxin [Mucilaginibacter polytrichastri]